jgi:hypothetical protein
VILDQPALLGVVLVGGLGAAGLLEIIAALSASPIARSNAANRRPRIDDKCRQQRRAAG